MRTYTTEQAGKIREALERIAAVRYGLEMSDTEEEAKAYWRDMALSYRATATAALAILSAPEAEGCKGHWRDGQVVFLSICDCNPQPPHSKPFMAVEADCHQEDARKVLDSLKDKPHSKHDGGE